MSHAVVFIILVIRQTEKLKTPTAPVVCVTSTKKIKIERTVEFTMKGNICDVPQKWCKSHYVSQFHASCKIEPDIFIIHNQFNEQRIST